MRLLPGLSLGGRASRRCARRWSSSTDCRPWSGAPPGWAAAPGATGATPPLLYQPQMLPQLAFGLTYRSRVKLDFTGRVDFDPGRRTSSPACPIRAARRSSPCRTSSASAARGRWPRPLALTFDANYVLWSTYDELVRRLRAGARSGPDARQQQRLHAAAGGRLVDAGRGAVGARRLHPRPEPVAVGERWPRRCPTPTGWTSAPGVGYRWRWARADLGYLLVYFLPSDSTTGAGGPGGDLQVARPVAGPDADGDVRLAFD